MELISSLAATCVPQFQSLVAKPVARAAAALMTPDVASRVTAQMLRAEPPTEGTLRPVLPPGVSEAIFKGLLPVSPALTRKVDGSESKKVQIETQTEVDGISLDGIPFANDGAVLLDDLPQPEPEPAPVREPEQAVAKPLATADPPPTETPTQADPEQERADHAERVYQEEREISAVRAEPAAPPPVEAAEPDHANPDPIKAPSVDKRA
ncbi:MAG: hypothetical protein U1A24_05500 [Cypionkella sp.]|uniref:hypothetical protein n=1 Tax=Cypionkella sp. TaxID=2811411 RepID=UPI002ABC0D41|nr:hypothetical protein [Cypionkella sp.]MDZ4309996.1 hypothetical protein [Cypionkella sp.]MDZ4394103.1 hypothetical protein [Cypionkella sp.]